MALDVFVGPLTRYYVGGWRRSVDKTSRRAPAAADAPRPGPDPRRDCARLHASVVAWRQTLDAALAPHLGEPLAWDESISAPWFTAQPGWRGFGSLVLWAAYAEQPGLRRPETLPTDWDDDPALVRSNADGFRSRYAQLVRNVELWLPHAFDFTFEGEDVDGRRILFGSAITLARQLGELNAATWKMDAREMAALAARRANEGASLDAGARQAMAVMGGLAEQAVRHRLPIKLDY